MKTLGLIGGLSWESTAVYYRLINEMVRERLGGLHSAKAVIWSFDFDEIAALQKAGEWDEATERMVEAGRALKAAGADVLVICTNTMHIMAHEVYKQTNMPVLHIVDAAAGPIKRAGHKKVGLLATKFTTEQEFYRERFRKLHGIEVIIPEEADRDELHAIVFNELCQGIIREDSKKRLMQITDNLIGSGAEAIVLGCTEICLLIGQDDVLVPVFDTTYLHALAAVEFMLSPPH